MALKQNRADVGLKTEAEEQKAEQTEENKEEVSAEIVPAVSVVSVQEEQESSFTLSLMGAFRPPAGKQTGKISESIR